MHLDMFLDDRTYGVFRQDGGPEVNCDLGSKVVRSGVLCEFWRAVGVLFDGLYEFRGPRVRS
jgi:hypothetical protein